jgi:hypothetical protein
MTEGTQESLPIFTKGLAAGRQEKATAATLKELKLGPADSALAQLALEAGRAVDQAIANHNPASFAKAATTLRETLAALRLGKQASGRDPFEQLLADLDDDDAGTTGAVRHAADT